MAVWNPRANEIFASVLELPAAQRQAHLEQACAGDAELKQQVEALLAAHGQAGSFLDQPFNPGDTPTLAPEAADVDPLLGTVRYIGDYEMLGELGRGGMGVVYKARQASLNRLVALKMILAGGHAGAARPGPLPHRGARRSPACSTPTSCRSTRSASTRASRSSRWNSAPAAAWTASSTARRWPPREAAQLVETLARAMQAAHEQNVIHRDLKPANVLLTRGRHARRSPTSAWPRSSTRRARRQSGAIMGTPRYMAPEQAGGKSKEHRARPATSTRWGRSSTNC